VTHYGLHLYLFYDLTWPLLFERPALTGGYELRLHKNECHLLFIFSGARLSLLYFAVPQTFRANLLLISRCQSADANLAALKFIQANFSVRFVIKWKNRPLPLMKVQSALNIDKD
jgi:hypothetical protein